MKIVAHISDLHFGTHDPAIEAALLGDLTGVTAPCPAAIAISGDLTQRARPAQFRAARRFLDRLTVPYVVVPGNHDIPLYDVIGRFSDPLGRYERYITDDLTPFYADDEIVIGGISTAHGFTFKGGKVRHAELEAAAAQLALHPQRWKLLVAHHPFVVPRNAPDNDLVDGAAEALVHLEAARVDLILSGHLHVAYSADAAGFRNEAHTVLAVHAGTCMSTRLRGEANGYNRLEIEDEHVTIVHRVWNGTQFIDGPEKAYRHGRGRERLVKELELPAQPQPL